MQGLDIVVCNAMLDETAEEIISESLQPHMDKLGVDYTLNFLPEGVLNTKLTENEPDLQIPHSAVVFAHANHHYNHENVGHIRRLAAERKDLKFIIQLQRGMIEKKRFNDIDDYIFASNLAMREFHPAWQQVLVSETPLPFFAGNFAGLMPQHTWKEYAEKIIDLRGPQTVWQNYNGQAAPQPKDIVICHNEIGQTSDDYLRPKDITYLISQTMKAIEKENGWKPDYNLVLLPEGALKDGSGIPQNAVVYAHGSLKTHHKPVGDLMSLRWQRPDLRFIVGVDPTYFHESEFRNPKSYFFLVHTLESGFSAGNQVVTSFGMMTDFLGSDANPPFRMEEEWSGSYLASLKDYLLQLKPAGGKNESAK